MKKFIMIIFILWGIINQSLYASDIGKTGDILQIVIPSVAYGTTLYLKDKEGEYQFYKSFATNLGATYTLKYAINRKRPNGGPYSFPSGHTSASFQGAAFIHARYGVKYAIPAYLLATFVGYSRVKTNAHYTSDVLAGAAIGIVSSFYFTTHYKNVQIKPIATESRYGIELSTNW